MKKIITSDITGSVGFPIKRGTLDHLQESYTEALTSIGTAIVADSSFVTVLHGCVYTGGGSLVVTAGAVFYAGEVYQVDAVSITAGPGVLLGTITVSNGIADPHTFTDATTHNVHNVRKMVITLGTSGTGTADFDDWLRPVKTKVIEIGAWDMDATAQVIIASGITDATKIRSIQTIIYNDAQTTAYPLNSDLIVSSIYQQFWQGNNIYLARVAAGLFDHPDYNDTSINRGYITIQYTT